MRSLEATLGISKTEVGASLKRSIASGLAIKERTTGRPKPNRRQLRDFITHGLKFAFPAEPGVIQRGLPTAFAAPELKEFLHGRQSHLHLALRTPKTWGSRSRPYSSVTPILKMSFAAEPSSRINC